MKNVIFIFAFAFVFGVFASFAFPLFAQIEDKDDIIFSLEQYQNEKMQFSGSFEQQKLSEYAPNFEVWVYQTPQKDLGYQIVEYAPDRSWISSKGYGPEASERSFLATLSKRYD